MNTAEIKIDLFRKIDSLKGSRLEEAYGVLLNFINKNIDDMQDLSLEQQEALSVGLEQLDRGEGKKHIEVISSVKKKFLNE